MERTIMNLEHIFIVGAGTMGNGIAQIAATSGYRVTCMDVQPAALEKAKATIQKSTTKLLEKEKIENGMSQSLFYLCTGTDLCRNSILPKTIS